MVGTSIGARNGVLFEGGDVLERVGDVEAVVFDKTGTLTEGEMELTDVRPIRAATDGAVPADGTESVRGDETASESDDAGSADATEELLAVAATAEHGSEHPIADAIVAGARDRGVEPGELTALQNVSGRGIRARTEHGDVVVGKPSLLADRGVPVDPAAPVVERLQSEGKTAVAVARDGELLGVLAVADEVKPTASEAVTALRDRGVAVHMLTGDNARTARAVADAVGIDPDNVRAEVLPDDKVAIGSGTDVAIEAADVTLMRSDPYHVVRALNVSEGTMAKIRQNLLWALGYNTLLIPLASLGLLQPVLAAGAMACPCCRTVSCSDGTTPTTGTGWRGCCGGSSGDYPSNSSITRSASVTNSETM
jgi:Cu+-exporting ATPase